MFEPMAAVAAMVAEDTAAVFMAVAAGSTVAAFMAAVSMVDMVSTAAIDFMLGGWGGWGYRGFGYAPIRIWFGSRARLWLGLGTRLRLWLSLLRRRSYGGCGYPYGYGYRYPYAYGYGSPYGYGGYGYGSPYGYGYSSPYGYGDGRWRWASAITPQRRSRILTWPRTAAQLQLPVRLLAPMAAQVLT